MTTKPQNDELARRLDAALAEYARVEPRSGLEERILANLRRQERGLPAQGWWQWAAVSVAAMLVMVLALFLSSKATKTQTENAPPRAIKKDQPIVNAARVFQAESRNSASSGRAIKTWPHGRVVVGGIPPRKEQFPSPEPLNGQEKMLADYVQQFEEQAILIARFTEEDLQRDRMELGIVPPPDSSSNDF